MGQGIILRKYRDNDGYKIVKIYENGTEYVPFKYYLENSSRVSVTKKSDCISIVNKQSNSGTMTLCTSQTVDLSNSIGLFVEYTGTACNYTGTYGRAFGYTSSVPTSNIQLGSLSSYSYFSNSSAKKEVGVFLLNSSVTKGAICITGTTNSGTHNIYKIYLLKKIS